MFDGLLDDNDEADAKGATAAAPPSHPAKAARVTGDYEPVPPSGSWAEMMEEAEEDEKEEGEEEEDEECGGASEESSVQYDHVHQVCLRWCASGLLMCLRCVGVPQVC